MSMFDRFFKPSKPKSETANIDLGTWRQDLSWKPTELIAVYSESFTTDRTVFAAQLQTFDPDLSIAFNAISVDSTISYNMPEQPIKLGPLDIDEASGERSFYWELSFGSHFFKLIGIHAPIPADAVEKA